MNTDDILRRIRIDLRRSMDGIVSKSMRDMGMDYKMNFGVSIMRLQELSKRYEKSVELAETLWKLDTRELKVLATMVYPKNEFTEEKADIWVKEIPNQEIREQFCKNLLQELNFADKLVQDWTISDDEEIRTTGYWLVGRLILSNSVLIDSMNLSEIIDRAFKDSISDSYFLRNAAQKALKLMGRVSKETANSILEKVSIYKDSVEPVKSEVYNSLNFEFSMLD